MNSRALGVATAVVVLALTGACSSHACTTIGANSGVSVEISGPRRTQPVAVDVCVAGRCSESSVEGPDGPVFVANPNVDSERPTRVTVTVRAQSGAVLVPPTEISMIPTRIQPNGADCEPMAYVGTVSVAP